MESHAESLATLRRKPLATADVAAIRRNTCERVIADSTASLRPVRASAPTVKGRGTSCLSLATGISSSFAATIFGRKDGPFTVTETLAMTGFTKGMAQ